MNEVGRRTIPYTELPELNDGGPLCAEWNTYRREVARLLAEGHEGKFVLIKGDQIVSMQDSWGAAEDEGLRLYLLEAFMIHEIRSREPLLRTRRYSLPCRRVHTQ
jgi:hypothetical protein